MRRSYIKENWDRYIDDHPTKEDALDLVDKNKWRWYIVEVWNFLHSDCVNVVRS